MSPAPVAPLAALLPAHPSAEAYDADVAYTAFAEWAESRGLPLYPAQDEAMMELVGGASVILSTPTGTGKSLVAAGAHFVGAVGR